MKKHDAVKRNYQGYFEKTLSPIIDDLAVNNNFSFDVLASRLIRNYEDITVNEAFENKIASLENDNKIGNASIYITTLKALMRFKHYSLKKRKADRQMFIETCIEKKHVTTEKNVTAGYVNMPMESLTTLPT